MTIGNFLVLVGTILAAIDLIVGVFAGAARRPTWLLALAVVLIGVGVLAGHTALGIHSGASR